MGVLDFLGNSDPSYLEELYRLYKQDPVLVDEQWRLFFEGFDFAQRQYPVKKQVGSGIPEELKVLNMITAYRQRGHYFTKTNPVRARRKYEPSLDHQQFGLSDADLDRRFHAGNELGIGDASLRDIIGFLQQTYCRSIGVEFMYIRNVEVVRWIRERMEGDRNTPAFSRSRKRQILESLTRAVGFEKFLHKKFPGFKTFSLEGGEALIPAMEAVIERAAALDYKEFVIGMPHRGRLNVLANILHKPYAAIFSEFEGGGFEEAHLLGDVKYHLGYSSTTVSASGKPIHLALCPNPSHLEAVNPVVGGIVKALAEREYQGSLQKALPFLIHGDAAVAGQGIVYEIMQMSELPAFRTGGTIHFVVNNQLGFTTNYLDGRSSVYCTDVAKVIQSPIFHVNGDDIEAVVHVALLAMEYRHRFGKDVFIDLLCYRKYGHNESDEPRFTQPLLYKLIEKHPNPLEIYREQLREENSIGQNEFDRLLGDFTQGLENGLFESKRSSLSSIRNFLEEHWKHLVSSTDDDFASSPNTGIDPKTLIEISRAISSLPADKTFFRKIVQLQEERGAMLENDRVDWAMAELLAFGSLLREGFPVRLCGQDVERGTFSQRHAVLKVEDSEEEYIPLEKLHADQAPFAVYNSLLSEYGVLGFEYGYALANPNGLTLWEAQFGDFMNGGQIIIDQFLCAAEEKWNVWNGLVMLLPHGYEGQGPEHSSGRMERFLAACAGNNLQVANCTTPANYFHLLRRQLHRGFRKPLVVFTPKSLLRHPSCVSGITAFTEGGFQEVISDNTVNADTVDRVLLCSGKVFYELQEARENKGRKDVAIVRIEQLYPFPQQQVDTLRLKYPKASEWLWVQEEPANMGAWSFLMRHLKGLAVLLVARPESGSPASGSSKIHKLRQQKIIDKAFGENCCEKRLEECQMYCSRSEKIIPD
jgi:2-oxoglutarate dehydrogenase E1 component